MTAALLLVSATAEAILRGEKEKLALRFTVTNLTSQVSLYNFESTFRGTHFVSPRAYSAELAYTF